MVENLKDCLEVAVDVVVLGEAAFKAGTFVKEEYKKYQTEKRQKEKDQTDTSD